MKMNRIYRLFFLCASAVLLAAGCDKQQDKGSVPEGEPAAMQLSFTVMAPDAVRTDPTRAVDAGPYQLTGQKGENEINTITLILVGVNGGKEVRTDMRYETLPVDAAEKYAAVHSCEVSLAGTLSMRQHVYIGANLSESMIQAFAAGEPFVSTASSARDVLDDVMDFDTDGKACNMTMFTKVMNPDAASDAADPYLFNLTGKDNLNGSTDRKIVLERLVSKVLLTFAMQDYGMITFTDRLGDAYKGWCTLEDINYVLTPAGRRTFLERTDTHDAFTSFLDSDLTAHDGRYLYFGTPFTDEAGASHPVAYDEDRMKSASASGADAATHYHEGIYCLESLSVNDVDDPKVYGKYVVMDDVARGAVPYLSIGFRYVPNRIHTNAADLGEETLFGSRAEAEAVLPEGLFYANEVPGHAGYYTQAAYDAAIAAGWSKAEFVAYRDGISYYRTFINAPAKDASLVQTYAGSTGQTVGLERNTYHIVSVPTVVLPGDAELRDYIRVNSRIIDWSFVGSTTVEVIP